MQLLSQIPIKDSDAVVQLLYGDLTAIPQEHEVDILVISAYPGSYIPVKGTLIEALYNKGLSVEKLAAQKEVDMLNEIGCWLSKPLIQELQDVLHFRRILCFEPYHHTVSPETVVGNIFRCINNFAFEDENNQIALPVLASGNQKAPLEKMLPAILDAAIFWLENGLPLSCIKLVLHTEEQVKAAQLIFDAVRKKYTGNIDDTAGTIFPQNPPVRFPGYVPPPAPASAPAAETGKEQPAVLPKPAVPQVQDKEFDFFISYSHKQGDPVKEFVEALKIKNKQLNIFYDRSTIQAGNLWLRQISDAIQRSKAVVCILTPEYSRSDVCWDEFQCAKLMELRKKIPIIKTINFLNDENLPPMMAIYSYIDCTEGDLQKLRDAVHQLCI